MSEYESLSAAKATRKAYRSNHPDDHVAAIAAHLKARGSEFAPQRPRGTNCQPNVDRWNHHNNQVEMHKAELKNVLTGGTMEFWQNDVKVAFTTTHDGGNPFANVGDVQVTEKFHVAGPIYRHTASFITSSDARIFLQAKYPYAEIRTSRGER